MAGWRTVGGMTGAPGDPIAAADRNMIRSFEQLVHTQPGGEMRRFGSVVAFDSRLPSRLFNGLAVFEPARDADVRDAVAWIEDRGSPYLAWVREDLADAVRDGLTVLGLEADEWREPVMGMRLPVELPAPPDSVSVRRVVDEPMLEDHIQSTIADGFPEAAVRPLYTMDLLTHPDVRAYTAYVDGRPVGNSIAIRTGDVAGIYSVGVRSGMRGRGIGSAVTWAAVGAAIGWDCWLTVLQSSEMGFGVYQRMRFEVLTHYEVFRRRAG